MGNAPVTLAIIPDPAGPLSATFQVVVVHKIVVPWALPTAINFHAFSVAHSATIEFIQFPEVVNA